LRLTPQSNTAFIIKTVKIKIYIITLPAVLCGYEILSLTQREEHRLSVSENRVLRRTFRPKREKVARGWGRLHNEELHNLYTSTDIIRGIKDDEMGGESRRMEKLGVHINFW
jgi:hypothetical protein